MKSIKEIEKLLNDWPHSPNPTIKEICKKLQIRPSKLFKVPNFNIKMVGMNYKMKIYAEVFKLKMKGKTYAQIEEQLGLSSSVVRDAAQKLRFKKDKETNIALKKYPNPKKLIEREQEIISLNEKGVPNTKIADKYNISKQRVYQILKNNDISRNKQIKENYEEIRNQIKSDLNNGLTLGQLIKKWGNYKKIRYYFPEIYKLTKQLREHRNKEIGKLYLNGNTAKEITNKTTPDTLLQPKQINGESHIYRINTKQGIKKYPNVGMKCYGGIFEDRKILQYIQNKRDKHNWSFSLITEKLNKLGYVTITGKEFKTPNVYEKYLSYKTKKYKKLKY
tara:strand:+ start:72 stop:1073 length:1002 start_codon:yes stop_codon:yes gene_type:complete